MGIATEIGPIFVEPYRSMDIGDPLYDERRLPN
jgi:hypothetical protein